MMSGVRYAWLRQRTYLSLREQGGNHPRCGAGLPCPSLLPPPICVSPLIIPVISPRWRRLPPAREGRASIGARAGATGTTVAPRRLPDAAVLTIAANGIGYTACAPAPVRADLPAGAIGGMALRGIRERRASRRVALPLVHQTEAPA